MIYSKPVFSLAEDGSGNLGHFPGSEDKEQRGLECCCPPRNAEPGCVTPCSPRADSRLLPSAPCHSSSQLCAAAPLLCLPGGAAKGPAYWLLPESLPFHTQTHPHTLCLAHTRSHTHMRAHSSLHAHCPQLLTSASPWNLSGKTLLIQQGRIVLISLFAALAF